VLTLIDTSAWIEALRQKGDDRVRVRVAQLLADGSAAWCAPVRLELWNGVRGNAERARLREMDAVLPRLAINDDVWNTACDYAIKARGAGLNLPAMDLLIFACAKHHGVALEHTDRHYDLLATLP
jgi:predicted nucleic acid-binding protein